MSETVDEEKEKFLQEQLKLLSLKVNEKRLNDVWTKFTEGGFSPILIKGWATAVFYPNPAERLYVDFDLVFDPVEFEPAQEFAKNSEMGFSIDYHEGARHLDSLSFAELFDRSVLKKCGEGEIRVPCDEDHLRIICVHWLNDGGTEKEKLWDIYHAVENRRSDFDWSKCLDVVDEQRRFWVICAIAIAHRYLGLAAEDLPFKDEFKNVPRWVYKALEKEWASGIRLMPLHYYVNDKKALWKQIKKRIPPNPIQATIDLRGKFNNTPRIFYQVGDILIRVLPSWKRIKDRLGIGNKYG